MGLFRSLLFELKCTALSIATTGMLAVSKIMIGALPFRKIISLITNSPEESPEHLDPASMGRAQRIGRSVAWVGRRVPWQSKCYDQALAASLLLRIMGISGTLYFGIWKDPTDSIGAHAWLRAGDVIITGAEEAPRFTQLYKGSFSGGLKTR